MSTIWEAVGGWGLDNETVCSLVSFIKLPSLKQFCIRCLFCSRLSLQLPLFVTYFSIYLVFFYVYFVFGCVASVCVFRTISPKLFYSVQLFFSVLSLLLLLLLVIPTSTQFYCASMGCQKKIIPIAWSSTIIIISYAWSVNKYRYCAYHI